METWQPLLGPCALADVRDPSGHSAPHAVGAHGRRCCRCSRSPGMRGFPVPRMGLASRWIPQPGLAATDWARTARSATAVRRPGVVRKREVPLHSSRCSGAVMSDRAVSTVDTYAAGGASPSLRSRVRTPLCRARAMARGCRAVRRMPALLPAVAAAMPGTVTTQATVFDCAAGRLIKRNRNGFSARPSTGLTPARVSTPGCAPASRHEQDGR